MPVSDWISACWYVSDIGHHLSSLWCLCETRYQLVGILQTLDANLMPAWCQPGHLLSAPGCPCEIDWDCISFCWHVSDIGHLLSALGCLWDYLPTWWYVWDIRHHPGAPWVKQRLNSHLATTLALHLYLASWMLGLSPQTWLCRLGGWVWHSTNYPIFLQVVVLSSCKS